MNSITAGQDVQVDYTSIEKTLAELWRVEKKEGDEHALTRAALWNVVAHAATSQQQAQASETLGRVAASVPQRTIIIRANPSDEAQIASWISANCHLVGGGKQVCSEEVAIVAGGDRVDRVPPLVNALLIPDMPVAVWWLGDLPSEDVEYVDALLEPADRWIVDSSHFDRAADLELVARVAQKTTTAPADLNWIRLEEWRTATATVFDPPEMRQRIREIRSIRIVSRTAEKNFGARADALLYASWIAAQLGHRVTESGEIEGADGGVEYRFEEQPAGEMTGLVRAEFTFRDSCVTTIVHEEEMDVLSTKTFGGSMRLPDSITRTGGRKIDDLIVRQLKAPESDRLLLKVLPVATSMARRSLR